MIKTKKWIASFLEMGDIMRYPDHWPKKYNACSEPCDVIDGPCCCGAWHCVEEDWVQSMIVAYGAEILILLRWTKNDSTFTVEKNQRKRTDDDLRGVFG